MSRLTRDGTAEPVSRDQIILGSNGDREVSMFLVDLTTSKIGNLIQLIHTTTTTTLATSLEILLFLRMFVPFIIIILLPFSLCMAWRVRRTFSLSGCTF